MTEVPTKKVLLHNIQSAHDLYMETINALSQEELLSALEPGGWTGKDIIAHVTTWEDFLCGWLQSSQSGTPPPQGRLFGDSSIDEINARVYSENQGRSIDQVLAEIQPTYEKVISLIKTTVDDTQLPNPLPFDWAGPDPLWRVIAANTYWHYDEHAASLHELSLKHHSQAD